MPIDFDTGDNNIADNLRRAQNLFDNPVGWGGRIVSIIGAALDRFQSAALRDVAGDTPAGNQVPLINEDGVVDAVFPSATNSDAGITNTSDVAVAFAALAAVNAVNGVIGNFRVNFSNVEMRFVNSGPVTNPIPVYRAQTSTTPSLLLIATRGEHSPADNAFPVSRFDAAGRSFVPAVSLFNNAELASNAGVIHLNDPSSIDVRMPNGSRVYVRGARDDPNRVVTDTETKSIYLLNAEQLAAFNLQWGIVFRRWGSQQGEGHGQSDLYFTQHGRTAGVSGDLLIAFKRGQTNIFTQTLFQPTQRTDPALAKSGYLTEISV